MRKLTALIAAAALAAVVAPAAEAAKGIPYKGKTSGGHEITFRLTKKGKKLIARDIVTGVPMSCLSIQGGGSPMTGVELWNFTWVEVPLKDYKWSEQSKPSFHYNEVTRNHTLTITRPGKRGVITGAVRVQYEFMIPKYPIGTFSIYSCLGNMKFSARPKG